MGNQQERSLAWLAGILEGEGTLSFQVYTMPNKRIRITPYVAVVNSDKGIIDEVCRIYRQIGVKYRNCAKPLSSRRNGSFDGNKRCFNIRCDGQEPVRRLAEALQPYMVGEKRRNVAAILEYLDSRARRGLERNERGHIRRVEYSRHEIEIISQIRSHKRAKSSEAICSAPNVVG